MDIHSIVQQRCEGREGVPGHQDQVDDLVRIFWCLLQPDGCPWDKKQTHESLSRHMIEEAYEAAEAMETGDIDNLEEELGDVLLQVALHSAIAQRDGEFTFNDVAARLNEKIIRRHPHIFGDLEANTEEDVLNIWQNVKKEEKADTKEDLFSGIPQSLPALKQAQLLIERAEENGRRPKQVDSFATANQCLNELQNSSLTDERAQEIIGDMLFSVVSVAKVYNVNAEEALRAACRSYRDGSDA